MKNGLKAYLVLAVAFLAVFIIKLVTNHNYMVSTTLMQVVAICLFTGVGFGLGWFLSPRARRFRQIALAASGLLLILVGLGDDGALGWGITYLLSWTGFFIALGYWLGAAVKALGARPTTFGSAEWAGYGYLKENGLIGESGLRLGRFASKDGIVPLHYSNDRHLLTSAPTRSGKGTTSIIPNLLTYSGSVLVIDPKGENAMITSEQRARMGQTVHVVDPWNIAAQGKAARFNPLDWLDPADPDMTENAMLLADALVIPASEADPFWSEEAKGLLQGIILYVATSPNEADERHLARVRDLLLLDGDDLKLLWQRMLDSEHHIVASTGARCLQKEERLLANVIASAQAQTHFLDSARVRQSLMASDFKFEDLKTEPMSIYLVLPADRLNAFSRWLRLMIQQAITVNARNVAVKPKRPVLFLLDELPALGRLSMVEQAFSLMAGFGMQLWGIVQDLGQLKKIYGEGGYESIISNCGAIQYFGSRDKLTAEYFSTLCGVTTVWNISTAIARAFGTSSGGGGGGSSSSTTSTETSSATQRKLAYPDELMRMPKNRSLILVEHHHPIMGVKQPWFEDSALKSLGRNLYPG